MGQKYWWMEKKNGKERTMVTTVALRCFSAIFVDNNPKPRPCTCKYMKRSSNKPISLNERQQVVAERPYQETPCTVGVGGGTGGNDFVGRKQRPPPLVAAFFVLHHFQLGVQITFRPVFFPNFLGHVWRCRRLLLSTSTRTRQRL